MTTSVVIPTRNEEHNVRPLLARLCAVLEREDEVLFVDDGSDGLPDVVAEEAARYPQDIRVHRRVAGTGGLAGAVVEGIRRSRGEHVVVCDGDLQHPPEVIPAMVGAAAGADVVVASRYREGGDAGGLSSAFRRSASRGTGVGSKALFPLKLRGCTDPMSGFFLVARRRLDLDALRPVGFKILLEILVRSPRMRITEVPFTFAAREAGQSNASLAEAFRFMRQMFMLRAWNRAVAYALVGLSGVVPNLAVLSVALHAGVHYTWAAVIAVQAAIVWNFVGAELFVWRDRRTTGFVKRFGLYALIGETDLLRIPFVVLLVSFLGMPTVVATLVTIAASFALRYVIADRRLYRAEPPAAAVDTPARAADLEPVA